MGFKYFRRSVSNYTAPAICADDNYSFSVRFFRPPLSQTKAMDVTMLRRLECAKQTKCKFTVRLPFIRFSSIHFSFPRLPTLSLAGARALFLRADFCIHCGAGEAPKIMPRRAVVFASSIPRSPFKLQALFELITRRKERKRDILL